MALGWKTPKIQKTLKNIVFSNDFEGPEGPKMASKGASKELLRQACIQEASNFAPRGLRMPPRAKKKMFGEPQDRLETILRRDFANMGPKRGWAWHEAWPIENRIFVIIGPITLDV